jgi:hypothetical protein
MSEITNMLDLNRKRREIDEYIKLLEGWLNGQPGLFGFNLVKPAIINVEGYFFKMVITVEKKIVLYRCAKHMEERYLGRDQQGQKLKREEVHVIHAMLPLAFAELMNNYNLADRFALFRGEFLKDSTPLETRVRCLLRLSLDKPTEAECVAAFENELKEFGGTVVTLATIVSFMPGNMAYADAAVVIGGQAVEIELYTRRNRDW